MFAFADVFHFLPNKLAGLSRWRFAFSFVFARAFNRFFLGHINLSPIALPMVGTIGGRPENKDSRFSVLFFNRDGRSSESFCEQAVPYRKLGMLRDVPSPWL